MVGGTSRSGTSRTDGVTGLYWISSNTSVRSTTAPGETARLPPMVNADVSTICGMRGAVAMSRNRFSPPRAKFSPAVSTAALTEAGFSNGTLLGASAANRFSARNRTRRSSRQSSSPSSMSPPTVPAAAR